MGSERYHLDHGYDLVNGQVELFATSYGLNELSKCYLYEITDNLAATSIPQVSSEQFTTLYTDNSGNTSSRGVAFAPVAAVPEPSSLALAAMAGGGNPEFHSKHYCQVNRQFTEVLGMGNSKTMSPASELKGLLACERICIADWPVLSCSGEVCRRANIQFTYIG